jgi:beta-xylosidase
MEVYDMSTKADGFSKNPIITTIFTADPSAHAWEDGRVYIYPSRDIDPARGCDLMDKYHVYSSEDMVNWVDHGEILSSDDVMWGRPEGGFMWAPDCAYKNGMYYFYFPHPSGSDWNNTWKIGIATSDKPASDFVVRGYIPGLEPMIDPCVFVDDDGQAYFYYGGGGVCKGGKLKDNMMEIEGELKLMEGLVDFHEATWVHKRNGIYYLSYSDNNDDGTNHNQMRYATSTNPLGPWTHRGVYIDPTDSYTNHGSIVEYKGQWYAFYHNSSVSDHDWLRSVCVDRLYYNEDGTIQKVELTTTGVPSVGPAPKPNPGVVKYEAEKAVLGCGATLEIDNAASTGTCIINLQLENSYCQFNNVCGGKGGMTTLEIYYAAKDKGVKLNLKVNGTDHLFINTVSTGDSGNFSGRAYLTVPFEAGASNTIKLTGGNGDVRIDYITVSPLMF